MSFLPDELPISLDKLDDHLKAILKIKIREFVHLNPVFNVIPSINVKSYSRSSDALALPNLTAREELTQAAVQSVPETVMAQIKLDYLKEEHFSFSEREKLEEAKAEVSGTLALRPRTYFAGYDEECPNKYRPTARRRSHLRRASV